MTSLSKELRTALDARFTLCRPEIVAEQVSADGTRKWLLRLPAEHAHERPHEVECVYIPETGRGTLCISSQVGCTLNCTLLPYRHAAAGPQSHRRGDRRPGHGRARSARRLAGADGPDAAERVRLVTNVVMMGMGEPLYNFDAVRDALLVVADNEGIAVSKRRITVSTSGVVPNIARTGEEIGVMLAVSLHATNNDLRDRLVPLNRKYPIEDLLAACRDYPACAMRGASPSNM